MGINRVLTLYKYILSVQPQMIAYSVQGLFNLPASVANTDARISASISGFFPTDSDQ